MTSAQGSAQPQLSTGTTERWNGPDLRRRRHQLVARRRRRDAVERLGEVRRDEPRAAAASQPGGDLPHYDDDDGTRGTVVQYSAVPRTVHCADRARPPTSDRPTPPSGVRRQASGSHCTQPGLRPRRRDDDRDVRVAKVVRNARRQQRQQQWWGRRCGAPPTHHHPETPKAPQPPPEIAFESPSNPAVTHRSHASDRGEATTTRRS